MCDDSDSLTLWGAACVIFVSLFVVYFVVLPALINMHDTGSLIAAVVVALGTPALTFITVRRLIRAYQEKGDSDQ